MPALARLLIGYRISIALGATAIATAIAALSGSWWALGYFYVFCDLLCSIVAIWVNRQDGVAAQVAHVAVTLIWLPTLFLTLPPLAMRIWPQ